MSVVTFDGESYQRRFDELSAGGADVHGEATFVLGLSPSSVLDAGCGTGRVAIELARAGVDVVGVDADESMLATARRRGAAVTWIRDDVADLDLDRCFDVVVMAGNVTLFTPPGTQAALVAGCARHVAAGGCLVAGFQLNRGYTVEAYDSHCGAAGLVVRQRWATWERRPWVDGGDYAVSVHGWADDRP
jgi:2-polyprenyl-3-methyl-5-hydroxy-6-metoxy-1,4-benzoquinol methylase